MAALLCTGGEKGSSVRFKETKIGPETHKPGDKDERDGDTGNPKSLLGLACRRRGTVPPTRTWGQRREERLEQADKTVYLKRVGVVRR